MKQRIEFNGSGLEYLGTAIVFFLIIFFSFGLATPWAATLFFRYDTDNMTIDGKKLKFRGSGIDLMGNWIVWLVLSIVTFGIYSFWIYPKLQKWRWENTEIME